MDYSVLIPVLYIHTMLTVITLSVFLDRPALYSRQPSGHQEHRHLSGGLLGGLKGGQTPGRILY